MGNTHIVNFDGIQIQVINNLLSTDDVALGYGITSKGIRAHKRLHYDELIEGVHYVSHEDKKFKTKITKWTLEGVHMLGFFIKSEQAKHFRKYVAKLLSEIKEENVKVISDDNSLLYAKERECIELKRAMNRITENEKLIFNDPQTHNAVLDLIGYASRATKTIKRLGEELIDYANQMENGLKTVEKLQGHKNGIVSQCNRLPRHQERRD